MSGQGKSELVMSGRGKSGWGKNGHLVIDELGLRRPACLLHCSESEV